MKRFFALLLAVTMLLGLVPTASMAEMDVVTVIGGWLRLREQPNYNATTITSYYTGTRMQVIGTSKGWYHVLAPDGRAGWMDSKFLTYGGSSSGGTGTAFVTSRNGYGVRLRTGPSTAYRIIRTYAVGTPVTVLERGNYWSRIRINGTTGYMMSQFLNFGGGSWNPGGDEQAVCYATIWSRNGYGVRLRTGPSKSYSKIGVYSVGTTVTVLQKGAVWDRVRVGSRVGWMMNEFLNYYSSNEVTSVTLNNTNPVVGSVLGVQAITPSNATVSYTWLVDGAERGSASTYTVTAADEGKQIQLRVTGTGNYKGTVLSAMTNKVVSNTILTNVTLNTTAPVAGNTLSAVITPEGATVSYAWKVDGKQVSNAATYTVSAADIGKKIELIVTGTGIYSGMASVTTAEVLSAGSVQGVSVRNDSSVGAAPTVGDKLTAMVSPAQATVSYQWMRNGSAISGATAMNYTVVDADVNATLSVQVIGSGVYSGNATSTATAAVQPKPAKPVIDGIALPGGKVNNAYSTQLSAQGGGTITWAITSDSVLPAGLTLSQSGAITGTPTTAGTFTFKVIASNVAGASDPVSFTIVVEAAAPAPEVSVTLSPNSASVMKGNTQTFTATVANASDPAVTWSLSGNASAGTTLVNGLLTVAADESAATLTVTATSVADATKSASANVTVTSEPVSLYTLTVENGSGSGQYAAGDVVAISANAAGGNEVFDFWAANDGSPFSDASSATTTFTMPAYDVTVIANYRTVITSYSFTVSSGTIVDENGNLLPTPPASYDAGTTVYLKADEPADPAEVFSHWEIISGDGQFYNRNNAFTYFVTGAEDTQLRAVYTAVTAYSLTVNGGVGSGTYNVGDVVSISAGAPAEGKQFAGWKRISGDGNFYNANSADTTFTMKASDVVIEATYEDIPAAPAAAPAADPIAAPETLSIEEPADMSTEDWSDTQTGEF